MVIPPIHCRSPSARLGFAGGSCWRTRRAVYHDATTCRVRPRPAAFARSCHPTIEGYGDNLAKLAGFAGATIGGAAGWWLGAHVGFMTAFFLSTLGTAAGVYCARRWISAHLP